jgi:ketosteroid isomerase-like protein
VSRENVEIVRRAMAASTAQPPDFETVNALYHHDHIATSDWGVEGRAYRGARGWAESNSDMDAAWQEWRQEIEDVLDAGEHGVLVLLRLKAIGRESGTPVDQRWAMLVTLRDGKLVSSRTIGDPSVALKAVGLEE